MQWHKQGADVGGLIGVLAFSSRLCASPSAESHVSCWHCLAVNVWPRDAGLLARVSAAVIKGNSVRRSQGVGQRAQVGGAQLWGRGFACDAERTFTGERRQGVRQRADRAHCTAHWAFTVGPVSPRHGAERSDQPHSDGAWPSHCRAFGSHFATAAAPLPRTYHVPHSATTRYRQRGVDSVIERMQSQSDMLEEATSMRSSQPAFAA